MSLVGALMSFHGATPVLPTCASSCHGLTAATVMKTESVVTKTDGWSRRQTRWSRRQTVWLRRQRCGCEDRRSYILGAQILHTPCGLFNPGEALISYKISNFEMQNESQKCMDAFPDSQILQFGPLAGPEHPHIIGLTSTVRPYHMLKVDIFSMAPAVARRGITA